MMLPIEFDDPQAREVYERYKFVLCDDAKATPDLDFASIDEQLSTERACKSALAALTEEQIACPDLFREQHITYFMNTLDGLCKDFANLESSRSWIAFWCLNGLRILKHQIPTSTLRNAVKFFVTCQQPTGGFGGSPSNTAHLATTYASVMGLVSIGTEEAYNVIDRENLYKFLLSVKQPNGCFAMHEDGEADVRGTYCAVAVATLTDIATDDLFADTAAWIVRCQTYEGGFGAEPLVEAHGGYTFCAVASLAMLKKLTMVNIDRLCYWCVQRQMSYEGGFQGRANKLVDACYSYWMGAIFPILHLSLNEVDNVKYNFGCLFEPRGLEDYSLLISVAQRGGMRDKPGRHPDPYHTSYALSGLSIAQAYSRQDGNEIRGGEQNDLNEVHPIYNVVSFYHEKAARFFCGLPSVQ